MSAGREGNDEKDDGDEKSRQIEAVNGIGRVKLGAGAHCGLVSGPFGLFNSKL